MAYYANSDERDRLIGGLRALSAFLYDHPHVPAPRWADLLVFPPDGTDEEQRTEIDMIASRIGAHTSESPRGHYSVSVVFGPVTYRAVAIPETPEASDEEKR
jgi:hypothetical protein